MKRLVIVIFLIQGLVDMVVINSGRGFPGKVLLMFWILSSTKIGYLTLNLKKVVEMDYLLKCGKSHSRNCLVGIDVCFEKSGFKMKDYPLQVPLGKDGWLAQPSGFGSVAP